MSKFFWRFSKLTILLSLSLAVFSTDTLADPAGNFTANQSSAASFVGSEGSDAFARCVSSAVGICPIAFAIVELDPETLTKSTLFESPDAPMGAATVGLKVNSRLFIGTFSGDRILQVNLDDEAYE